MIFGTYILYNTENKMMLSLCNCVNSYSPEGATKLSICSTAVLLSLNFFTLKQCILYAFITKIFMVNTNLSGFAI